MSRLSRLSVCLSVWSVGWVWSFAPYYLLLINKVDNALTHLHSSTGSNSAPIRCIECVAACQIVTTGYLCFPQEMDSPTIYFAFLFFSFTNWLWYGRCEYISSNNHYAKIQYVSFFIPFCKSNSARSREINNVQDVKR
ncbi:hypothetical protein HELRODRAFT_167886 [Helobdella robusta]|uniref:Uncharacterized protein n=1 Tax=Helobdella robusta TaxID=6412 RepID=T1EZX3_HELRO|nr:hypothetical protein HELRODRAFT_167886 [Helobdella robusta]ESO10043.1 hypothetical protein HELRODRAFT_167886 [Helobdella robusta]